MLRSDTQVIILLGNRQAVRRLTAAAPSEVKVVDADQWFLSAVSKATGLSMESLGLYSDKDMQGEMSLDKGTLGVFAAYMNLSRVSTNNILNKTSVQDGVKHLQNVMSKYSPHKDGWLLQNAVDMLYYSQPVKRVLVSIEGLDLKEFMQTLAHYNLASRARYVVLIPRAASGEKVLQYEGDLPPSYSEIVIEEGTSLTDVVDDVFNSKSKAHSKPKQKRPSPKRRQAKKQVEPETPKEEIKENTDE